MWLHFVIIILVLSLHLVSYVFSKNHNRNVIYLWLIFFVLFIISGFRSTSVGVDTLSYYNLYINIANSPQSYFEYSSRVELGYFMFNKLLALISDNPQILFLVSSFITLMLYFIFIKLNSPSIWLSIYLLITSLEFYGTMNLLRQSMAIAIVLISYEFVKKQKPFYFVITVLVASLFHVSALVFLVVYLFRSVKFNIKYALMPISIALVIFLSYDFIASILATSPIRYASYIYDDRFIDIKIGSIINFLVSLVVLIIGILLNVNEKHSEKQKIVVLRGGDCSYKNGNNLLTYICLIGTLLSLISIKFSLLARIADYFTVFIIVYIPTIIKSTHDNKLMILITYLVVVLFLLYSTVILYFRPEWNMVFPYTFF